MEETDKVSVILPAYQVEEYIGQALESLIQQTYHNLEIIVVDDGAKDRSGEIAEAYARKDPRIRVIHQENRGLAEACNTGLRESTGDIILWLDPDDYLDPDAVEYAVCNLTKHNADIVIYGLYEEFERKTNIVSWDHECILSSEEALELLVVDHHMRSYRWDKIMRREMYDGIRYKRRCFEDLDVSYLLVDRANKIVCLPEPKLHYRQRSGSMLRKIDFTKSLNLYQAIEERYLYLSEKYPRLEPLMRAQRVAFAMDLWATYDVATLEEKAAHQGYMESISLYCKENADVVMPYLSFSKKDLKLLFDCTPKSFKTTAKINIIENNRMTGFGHISYPWCHELTATETVEPVFDQDAITLTFLCDEYHSAFLAVMIQSILEHSDSSRKYDIVIFHREITCYTQIKLKNLAKQMGNVSIRIINIANMVKNVRGQLEQKYHHSIDLDGYIRLLIPDILSKKYHKVLYLENEMIALTDVAKLYDEDISGYYLGSTRDICGLAEYYDNRGSQKTYWNQFLGLKQPENYFVAGVLLLNLDSLRKDYPLDSLIELAVSRPWKAHAQDVLNVICNDGQAKLFDDAWQLLPRHKEENLPFEIVKAYETAYIHPKIVSYCGNQKPWYGNAHLASSYFWTAVMNTTFMVDVLDRVMNSQTENADAYNREMEVRFYQGKAGLRHVFRYLRGWFVYKLRRFNLISETRIPDHSRP